MTLRWQTRHASVAVIHDTSLKNGELEVAEYSLVAFRFEVAPVHGGSEKVVLRVAWMTSVGHRGQEMPTRTEPPGDSL